MIYYYINNIEFEYLWWGDFHIRLQPGFMDLNAYALITTDKSHAMSEEFESLLKLNKLQVVDKKFFMEKYIKCMEIITNNLKDKI